MYTQETLLAVYNIHTISILYIVYILWHCIHWYILALMCWAVLLLVCVSFTPTQKNRSCWCASKYTMHLSWGLQWCVRMCVCVCVSVCVLLTFGEGVVVTEHLSGIQHRHLQLWAVTNKTLNKYLPHIVRHKREWVQHVYLGASICYIWICNHHTPYIHVHIHTNTHSTCTRIHAHTHAHAHACTPTDTHTTYFSILKQTLLLLLGRLWWSKRVTPTRQSGLASHMFQNAVMRQEEQKGRLP